MHIKKAKKLRMVSTGAFCVLGVIGFLGVFPITKTSDDAEATVTPATTTLTMTSSSTTASVSVTPMSSNGTFATSESADEVAFTVTTNNVTGYNLTIAGSDDTRQLSNTDAAATLDSISATTTAADFASGAAATYSNKWGYKPSFYNGAANTNYLQAPTTTAETLNQTTSANTTADTYTIGLGARVDYTKPVGTYTNTFVIEAVANNVAYQINYLDNSGATVTGLPAAEGSSIATASAFTLASGTPARTGYTFQGWCYGTADYTTNPTGCTGTTYQAGDNFVFTSYSSTSTNTANLYAMWKLDKLYIQDYTKATCQTDAASGNVTLTDKRDNNDYTVRYINGNCWMTQNLRYQGDTVGSTSTTTSWIMKSATSNISTDTTMTMTDLTAGNSYDVARYHVPTSTQIPSGLTANDIGVWYNYAAASAMTITGSSNQNPQTYDICPKGWRLPTNTEQSGITSYASAYSPVTGGDFYGGTLDSTGYGSWWSSTSSSTANRYSLNWSGSSLSTSYGIRLSGYYVRCIRS
ncbi:hypothetical protein IJI86_00405 [Candidatus Saccharibacteria bacterium]|nr:hypothetical protein [Candidatus Saccharibacteria bacterium]